MTDETRIEDNQGQTRIESGANPGQGRLSLVEQKFHANDVDWLITKELPASGGEADLYLLKAEGNKRAMLKLYRKGIAPKEEILQLLGDLDPEHVVQVYDVGMRDGRAYELQEFIEKGSLADLMNGSGALPLPKAKKYLGEILHSVEHLHGHGIIHRDLKPGNILVRSKRPLDLVVTDFGIASRTDLSLVQTSSNRTVAYASPEALTGVVSKESDWWSVGVILLEMVTGRHPFEGIGEQAMNYQLATRGVDVPGDLDEGWRLLLRGLLTRDRDHRWGGEEIKRWLAGKRDIPVLQEGTAATAVGKQYDYKPYKFSRKEYYETAELAVALARDWEKAVKHLGRGFITAWVKDELADADLASELMDVVEDESLSAHQRLSVALLVLSPELPLVDSKGVLNKETLSSRAGELKGIFESSLGKWLGDIRGEDWLVESGDQYRSFFKFKAIEKYGEELDLELLEQYYCMDSEILAGEFSDLKAKRFLLKSKQLKKEMNSPKPSRKWMVTLLSLKPSFWLKEEEAERKREEAARKRQEAKQKREEWNRKRVEERRKREEEAKRKREEEAKRMKEEEEEAERRRRVEWHRQRQEKAKRKLEEEAKAKREEAKRIKAEEAKAKREEAKRIKAEEAKAKRQEAKRIKAEEAKAKRQEAKRIRIEEAKAKRQEAQRKQEEEAKFLSQKEFTVPDIGLEMLRVENGSFRMGSPFSEKGRSNDEDQHRVTLSKVFWLGKYPVTQMQWEQLMRNNPSKFIGANLPVENVNWEDAMEFCEVLNRKHGNGLPTGYAYCLPTEAEWEYACRAGTTTAFAIDQQKSLRRNIFSIFGFGDSLSHQQATFSSRGGTTQVGKYAPNPWDFYDMHGNVWEWCYDWYGRYEYKPGSVADPVGSRVGTSRVCRGGSWGSKAKFCRSASREWGTPDKHNSNLGFRLCLSSVKK